jgi:hypothetical protein
LIAQAASFCSPFSTQLSALAKAICLHISTWGSGKSRCCVSEPNGLLRSNNDNWLILSFRLILLSARFSIRFNLERDFNEIDDRLSQSKTWWTNYTFSRQDIRMVYTI